MSHKGESITSQDVFQGKDRQMVCEETRLASFVRWPFSDGKCTKEAMSGCGFYHCNIAGEVDGVRCFFCLKELDGWDPSDDPWAEHKRNNKCYFANLNKTQDKLTVKEFLKAIEEREIILLQRRYETMSELDEKLIQELALEADFESRSRK